MRALVRRDAAASRQAMTQLTALVAALHARERSAPGGDVSLVAVLGDDALVAMLHAIATRALVRDDDDVLVHDALALLVALLEAQFARPAAGAYWSRQFFFECDFAESLIAVLLRESAKKVPPTLVIADGAAVVIPPVLCSPLALHALAALCNARPIENADVC